MPSNFDDDFFDANPHIEGEWWIEPGIAHPQLITGQGNLVQVFHDLHKKDNRKWANYAIYLGWFHSPSLRKPTPKEWIEDAAMRANLIEAPGEMESKGEDELAPYLCSAPSHISWRYFYKVLGYQMHYAFARVVSLGLSYEQLRLHLMANMPELIKNNPKHLAESMRILREDTEMLMETHRNIAYMSHHRDEIEEGLRSLREQDLYNQNTDSEYAGIEEEVLSDDA